MTAEHGDHSRKRHLVGVHKQTGKAVFIDDELDAQKFKINAEHQQRQSCRAEHGGEIDDDAADIEQLVPKIELLFGVHRIKNKEADGDVQQERKIQKSIVEHMQQQCHCRRHKKRYQPKAVARAQRGAVDLVGLVLHAADGGRLVHHDAFLVELAQVVDHVVHIVHGDDGELGHLHGLGTDTVHVEELQTCGSGLHVVHDVIERQRQRRDVLAVKRRDERRVELLHDGAHLLVAVGLVDLEARDARDGVRELAEHLHVLLARLLDSGRDVTQQTKELVLFLYTKGHRAALLQSILVDTATG